MKCHPTGGFAFSPLCVSRIKNLYVHNNMQLPYKDHLSPLHTVLEFLGNRGIRRWLFFFLLSEIYLIFLFFALTLSNKLLEESGPAAGLLDAFLHPSHPQRQVGHVNMDNKNTSVLVLHMGSFEIILESSFISTGAACRYWSVAAADVVTAVFAHGCSAVPFVPTGCHGKP